MNRCTILENLGAQSNKQQGYAIDLGQSFKKMFYCPLITCQEMGGSVGRGNFFFLGNNAILAIHTQPTYICP